MTKEELLEYKKKLSSLNKEEQKLRDLYLRRIQLGKVDGPITGYPSIDKPWLKYHDEEMIMEDIPEKSIYQCAFECNKDNMDSVAIDVRSGINNYETPLLEIKYNDYFKNQEKLAKSSYELGTKVDEIIPIITINQPEARTLIYSNSLIGATTYPISPLLPANELNRILEQNPIRTVFVSNYLLDKYKDVLKDSKIENIVYLDTQGADEKRFKTNNGKNNILLDEFYKIGSNVTKKIKPYYDENHVAVIIGTSGTTGTSKGVCLTDKNINAAAYSYKNSKFFKGSFMDLLLPSIAYGVAMLHYQTICGSHVYLIPELLTTRFPEALTKIKPDIIAGGPVHYINLAESEEFKNKTYPKNTFYLSGGATLPKNIEEKLNGVSKGYAEDGTINENIVVRQGYSLSENTAVATVNKKGAYTFGSIGIPAVYETIGIFEPDTDFELPYNTPGEICIQSEASMSRYLNNKEETEKVIKIHSDGKKWIHTKDIGYIDETGHLFHMDRIKNIFMRTGFNVHPNAIADFINSSKYVKNSVVIGFEHPQEQTVPVAFIVLDDSICKQISHDDIREELKKYCYENLEETSIPMDYVFVDNLPINAGGKVDLKLLKETSGIDYNKENKALVKELKFN